MPPRVRPPAAAGRFYPADPGTLRAAVDRLLEEAPRHKAEGRVVAALCPHAGYDYSGAPTARVCRALAGLAPEVVAVVGTAHFADREGFFLSGHAAWRTPLGDLPVAEKEAALLLKSDAGVTASAEAHAQEHSVEVVLPFLQRTFPDFTLLPLVSNGQSRSEAERVGRALAGVLKGRKALVIAASDLSHYPALEVARQVDPASLESFLTLEPDYLWSTEEALMSIGAPELHCTWCGKAAAAAVQAAAAGLGADWGEALDCANSAGRSGDESRTVGYGAAILTVRGRPRPWPLEQVTTEEKAELLALARASVLDALEGRRHAQRLFDRPRFNLPAAVFVTWTRRTGGLRGCIGATVPRDTLGNAVARLAVCSAADDPRFAPVSAEELSGLRAEISILSAPRPARPEDIRPGLGVIVRRGARQGLFLPQVWEQLPGRDEFMEHLCEHKAGLPPDAWTKDGVQLQIFTVTAFAEPR
ncbi:MAG: AmmeMemoRadiSam system protein B [Elusimicrobia bacterium]|nr:AmmeMemoRadiSam system protein B [Elusimicrobiota bacterium]